MEYLLENNILNIKIDSIFEDNIQAFFDTYIPSKKIQHLLIQNKWILLDGNPCKRESDIVGEYLNINIYPTINEYEKIKNKIDIVYEDEILLVVNKPKDLIIHSDKDEITLNKMVESYYSDNNYISPLPLHRLDKETSGLVIYSKSIIFQPLLDKLMNEKQIRRSYLAFVDGIFDKDNILIDKKIGRDRHNNNKYVVTQSGRDAITKIKKDRVNKKKNYSILRCNLDTGRTHQIRVHLKDLGYTILNDEIYGKQSSLTKRMGLCADNISFFHPLKEENININIDLPNDLLELYDKAI